MNKNEIYVTLHSREELAEAQEILEKFEEYLSFNKNAGGSFPDAGYLDLCMVGSSWHVGRRGKDQEHLKHVDIPELEEILRKERNLVEQPAVYDFVNPQHYKKMSVETWEMMVSIWGAEKYMAHCEMSAFGYRMRLGEKPDQPVERDLEKARWYEDMAKRIKDEYKLG